MQKWQMLLVVCCTFTSTNSEGEFTLPINPFSTARSLEISSGNLVTSIAVSPEQIENLKIPLIANSRTVKGTVFDAVNKEKTVSNVSVKVSGTNTSSVTDEKGNFILRGVPLNSTSLELGDIEGYNSARVTVPSATDSSDTLLQPVFMRPIVIYLLLFSLIILGHIMGWDLSLPTPGSSFFG